MLYMYRCWAILMSQRTVLNIILSNADLSVAVSTQPYAYVTYDITCNIVYKLTWNNLFFYAVTQGDQSQGEKQQQQQQVPTATTTTLHTDDRNKQQQTIYLLVQCFQKQSNISNRLTVKLSELEIWRSQISSFQRNSSS